jgi:hypothetical protein
VIACLPYQPVQAAGHVHDGSLKPIVARPKAFPGSKQSLAVAVRMENLAIAADDEGCERHTLQRIER